MIAKTVRESLEFKRGQDPKKSLALGNHRFDKQLRDNFFVEGKIADIEDEFGVTLNLTKSERIDLVRKILVDKIEIRVETLNYYEWGLYHMQLRDGEYRWNHENIYENFYEKKLSPLYSAGWELFHDYKDVRNEDYYILIRKPISESYGFQRGKNPKQALGLGLLKDVTSEDLYNIILYNSYDFEESKEFFTSDKNLSSILSNIIEIGKMFTWKEHHLMKKYVKENAKGRYVYNGSPGMSDTYVVFSNQELPSAEVLTYNQDKLDYEEVYDEIYKYVYHYEHGVYPKTSYRGTDF